MIGAQRLLRHGRRHQRPDHHARHARGLPRPHQGPRRRADDRIEGFGALGVERVFGIPLPVYIFCGLRSRVLARAPLHGLRPLLVIAIGASPSAARLAGIRTKRVIFIAFLLSSAMVALAGLIRLSQVAGASVNSGLGIEPSVIAGGRPRRREPVRRPWRSRWHGPGGAHRRGPGQRPHPAQRAVVLDRGGRRAPAAGCRDRRSRARAD